MTPTYVYFKNNIDGSQYDFKYSYWKTFVTSDTESNLKKYLICIFDKYAGMGVHKYLLKLKIKAAMELLADGNGVAVVAEKVGFGSQSYFSKAFKRETGQNPTDFKM